MSDRYARSEQLHERALHTIPLGTQTFSKSQTQYPFGVSPYFVSKGKGGHVWDVDGNEYLDFINSLGAITLGYSDPEITAAVQRQLEDGVTFSLPHPLEIDVAEKVVEMVPCAERVRFGKNGSDATTGAIRLARAWTGRDHVAVCGYHGWHDWYIGSTSRHFGVPLATRELTHSFTYNDLDTLATLFREYPGQIAAVIMEPMSTVEPEPNFLAEVKAMAHTHGALLIFDEVVTGFRFANGGAQEYFGVTPDLASLGKGMANGYPLSAVVGRTDVMALMEEIFFSFTFGGETLSLAASLATLTKLEEQPVIETMTQQGMLLASGVKELIRRHEIDHFLSIQGHPTLTGLVFRDVEPYGQFDIKTLFLQEVFRRGVLTLGTHNLSYAHTSTDINQLLNVYDEVFAMLRLAVNERRLPRMLECEPLRPLFRIR